MVVGMMLALMDLGSRIKSEIDFFSKKTEV